MSLNGILLIPGESGWRIGTIEADPSRSPQFLSVEAPAAAPEAIAAQVAVALKERGYEGDDVILGLPGAWCFAADFILPQGKPRRPDVLALQLEEQLPISAEEFVADFVDVGEQVLGIAGRLDLISPTVTALEAQNVHIAHVTPLALLALQSLAPQLPQTHACVLWQEADQTNVMRLKGGRLLSWSLVPANAGDIAAELGRLSLDQPVDSLWCNVEPSLADELKRRSITFAGFDSDMSAAALSTANRIAAGVERLMVDLRRGPLAPPDPLRQMRSMLNAVLIAAIIFLSVAGISMLIRSSRYQRAAAASEAQQAVSFKQAFPNAAVPVSIKARLEAEHRSIGSAPTRSDPPSAPAILLLRDLLGHLPPSAKVDLNRVVVNGRQFRLEGTVASPDQLTALSTAIAAATSTKLEPLSVQRSPNGAFSFVVQSAVPAPTTAPAPIASTKEVP